MTPFHKSVTRLTDEVHRVLTTKPRRIVATFAPGYVIEFREHGCRTRFVLPVERAFKLAVWIKVQQDREARKAARKARRK